ncbi:RebB family R body protein [Pyxidicoccus parkwayensis]|jgi:Killing trait|uniref:RebB family R body protein n=1 Tax=Pyxidicoccus parkwayensis TaxID=2813578 RepID=A0ABX7NUA2_9BACT|nr:RebB family R body protein [Pyxidicoccus parkwaysis]QSQ21954.1 RebB family R body protein [Pyxidicoccus parkwaysis]
MADTVNPQVTDAVTTTVSATVGEAASVAMGMFYQAEAQVFALGMQNTVNSQQNVMRIGEAVLAVATTKIMALLK